MEQDPRDRIVHAFLLEKLADFQRLTLLGRLSSSLTHEINNHLTGVSGYAQLLLGQDRSQAVEKELEKINSSANECKKLILNFKRCARFQHEEKEYSSLNLILEQAIDLFRRQFRKKELAIKEDYAPDVPVIEIDSVAMEQVFLNVIQNSFEALQEDGTGLSITTRTENGRIMAVFDDDGPGISSDAILHLFVPFFTTKNHLHCPGLGLAAAKMLLKNMDGEIVVEALPERGTRVKILLPLDEEKQEQDTNEDHE